MTGASENLIREMCKCGQVKGELTETKFGLDYRIPVLELPAVRAYLEGLDVCERCSGSERDPNGGPCAKCIGGDQHLHDADIAAKDGWA